MTDYKRIEDPPELGLAEALLQVDEEKSELDKILEQFLNPANIKHNTAFTKKEIRAFSIAATIAKKYNFSMLKEWLEEEYTHRVSEGRAGRKEWVKIISRERQEEREMGKMDHFRRLMRR